MGAFLDNPLLLYVTNPTYHTNQFTLATFHQPMANSVSRLQFSQDGTSNTWQAGMSSESSSVIRASYATNLGVNPNGDVALTGDLKVAGRILIDGSHSNVQPKSSTSS